MWGSLWATPGFTVQSSRDLQGKNKFTSALLLKETLLLTVLCKQQQKEAFTYTSLHQEFTFFPLFDRVHPNESSKAQAGTTTPCPTRPACSSHCLALPGPLANLRICQLLLAHPPPLTWNVTSQTVPIPSFSLQGSSSPSPLQSTTDPSTVNLGALVLTFFPNLLICDCCN